MTDMTSNISEEIPEKVETQKSPQHILRLKVREDCPNRSFVEDFYKNKSQEIGYKGDCGIDLIFPQPVCFIANSVTACDLGISCAFYSNGDTTESTAFRLEPRSSIIKTSLMLANSSGIIDPGYRGPIIAAFRCFENSQEKSIKSCIYEVSRGDRLVQIVAPDLKPIRLEVVDELSETDRGSNGFGSTN